MYLDTLDKEVLESQVLRTSILLSCFALVILYQLFWQYFFPEQYKLVFTEIKKWIIWLVIFSLLAYYFFLRLIIKACISRSIKISRWVLFLTTLVETSLPSLYILAFSFKHPLAEVLLSSTILVYFIYIILSSLYLDYLICVFTGLVAFLEYISITHFHAAHPKNIFLGQEFIFSEQQIFARGLIFLIAGLVAGIVTQKIKTGMIKAFNATTAREELANIFGRHVSPEVVSMLLNQNEGQKSATKWVAVLFLDVRNFTAFSEDKKPQEVVEFLNRLFDFMIDIVNLHHGIINKFLGDGFMAIFGAPIEDEQSSDNAVMVAEKILARVEHEIYLKKIPPIKIGIGIHCGEVVTGTIGAKKRQEYTIIGDVVNLASRIEELNKEYSSQLLISEDVYLRLTKKRGTLLGQTSVRGRQTSIAVYCLL